MLKLDSKNLNKLRLFLEQRDELIDEYYKIKGKFEDEREVK